MLPTNYHLLQPTLKLSQNQLNLAHEPKFSPPSPKRPNGSVKSTFGCGCLKNSSCFAVSIRRPSIPRLVLPVNGASVRGKFPTLVASCAGRFRVLMGLGHWSKRPHLVSALLSPPWLLTFPHPSTFLPLTFLYLFSSILYSTPICSVFLCSALLRILFWESFELFSSLLCSTLLRVSLHLLSSPCFSAALFCSCLPITSALWRCLYAFLLFAWCEEIFVCLLLQDGLSVVPFVEVRRRKQPGPKSSAKQSLCDSKEHTDAAKRQA